MRNAILAVVTAVTVTAALPAEAKKKEVSTLELQQIQSREFDVTRNEAFAAVMTVLQDSGYRIGSADRDTGLITGAASTKTGTTWMPFVGFGKKKKTPVVSAYVEERGPNVTRVRLNFVMTKSTANQFGGQDDETPILEPSVYQDAFERINKEVFVRVAMRTAGGTTTAAATAPAAAPASTGSTLTPAVATTPR